MFEIIVSVYFENVDVTVKIQIHLGAKFLLTVPVKELMFAMFNISPL